MSTVINLGTVHPVYKGTYSSTVAYEFLNRVVDGNGKTYEAKQDNMAGSDLSDEGIWQLIFDANKNLEVDSIKTGNAVSGGVGQRLWANELCQYGTNGNETVYNTYDGGEAFAVLLRDSDKVTLSGMTFSENGAIKNAKTDKEIPDIQVINFYNANGNDTDLISENVYGDTSVGLANVWIDGAIIGNIATLTIKLKILGFSAVLPTDAGFFFGFNLLRRLKILTDVLTTSDSFAVGMIDFNQDVNILACRAYINSNGYLNFSLEDSGAGGSGATNASVTCTEAEVSTTITFQVGRG